MTLGNDVAGTVLSYTRLLTEKPRRKDANRNSSSGKNYSAKCYKTDSSMMLRLEGICTVSVSLQKVGPNYKGKSNDFIVEKPSHHTNPDPCKNH